MDALTGGLAPILQTGFQRLLHKLGRTLAQPARLGRQAVFQVIRQLNGQSPHGVKATVPVRIRQAATPRLPRLMVFTRGLSFCSFSAFWRLWLAAKPKWRN